MKIMFVIAHRYYRQFQSYLKYYVDNIQRFYGNDSYILIVDNNSKYLEDIRDILKDYQNLSIIVNDTICKFEIGAYKKGIEYIFENKLLEEFDYFAFTQDNFILKNRFDFNTLKTKNTMACALNFSIHTDKNYDVYIPLLQNIGIVDALPHMNLCWCSSFILHKSRVMIFYDMTRNILLTNRLDSEAGERYLSAILYKLNNDIVDSIDGEIVPPELLTYDCWKVDLINDPVPNRFFVKSVQQKTERTPEVN
jgi:hypothetical protein